jgi:glycosyltransferase involved in cell wall biosynthesis
MRGAATVNSIAMIIPGLDRIGGAEQQMLLLARGLHNRGWQVSVVALSGSGAAAARQLAADGIPFTSLAMRKGLADPRGWLRFHRWLRHHRPDVLHAHLPHAVWLARWSRLAAPVRVLVDTLHTTATGGLGRRLGYRASNWLPDRVSAVSQAVAQAYLAAGMVSQNKLTILPNGVDIDHWKPDAQTRSEMRTEIGVRDEFIFLAAGRLEPVKDYPALLTALAAMPPSVQLLVAGSGPLEAMLRDLANQLGISARVRFLGFQPDLRRYMQAADAFVLSSRWEGLPMGILEAAACGLPTVATEVPGTREAVTDGQTGLLAPPGDAQALRDAMTQMTQLPPPTREQMGRSARQFVADRFSLEAVLDRWEALYQELLKHSQSAARRA